MPLLLAPGDRCDDYEIVASLGTSGAAELYLARAPSGEPCVLKIMAAPGADKQRLRFAQEGVVLAKIASANVIRVFAAGALGEHVWLAIERFGEQTLADRLRAGGPLPLDDLLGWAQQVCAGLAEAHRLEIVHRNLTPESVVLGPGGLVKLGEFGMAKLASFGVVTTADQQTGAVLYAAPEQLLGKLEVGPRADLYGLGVLLYEAIAGVRPMGPGPLNAMTVVSWHLEEQARPLHEHVPSVPADLEALVHQMLEKAPSMRPASALEVHDRLRDVRVGLRAPLLREVRNAAPVGPVSLAPTQRMAAALGPEEDRPAVLPAQVPSSPSPSPNSERDRAPARAWMGTMPLPEAPGEVRVTGEPVEREARMSRPASRWAAGAAIGAGVLALAAAAATAWTLWSPRPGPALGAGTETSAAPATPRLPDAGVLKHPRHRAR